MLYWNNHVNFYRCSSGIKKDSRWRQHSVNIDSMLTTLGTVMNNHVVPSILQVSHRVDNIYFDRFHSVIKIQGDSKEPASPLLLSLVNII
jgi:hypothetical protein